MRRRMNHFVVEGLAIALMLTGSALAQAQEADSSATSAPAATEGAAPAEAPAPATPAAAAPATAGSDTSKLVLDGPRFRFGVSGGAGFFTAAPEGSSTSIGCTYFGADLRLGAQINDLIGVYAQPTLGYYTADVGVLAA